MWPYYNIWGGAGACPWVGMLFMTMLIVAGIVIAVLLLRGKTGIPPSSSGARQILDERYAKGEIDRQQYEQMKKDLR